MSHIVKPPIGIISRIEFLGVNLFSGGGNLFANQAFSAKVETNQVTLTSESYIEANSFVNLPPIFTIQFNC